VPRTFPPAPGWSPDGHRIKAPLDYGRDPEKTWVYGALRVRDGKELTRCAASRNSKGYIALLADIEADNPTGDLFIITDNLSSHSSLETRTWLEGHPRIHHVFIPTGACWLNEARRAGGASSVAMRSPDRVLPIPRRSSKPPASRRLNSTGEPNRGSGVDLAIRSSPLSPTLLLPYLRNLALVLQPHLGSQTSCTPFDM
jgi:DDE superfamily endonuclease